MSKQIETRRAIIGAPPHSQFIKDQRTAVVSLPREPWEGEERRVQLPGDRAQAGRYVPDRMPAGAARVALVKRWLREADAMEPDHLPGEVVL